MMKEDRSKRIANLIDYNRGLCERMARMRHAHSAAITEAVLAERERALEEGAQGGWISVPVLSNVEIDALQTWKRQLARAILEEVWDCQEQEFNSDYTTQRIHSMLLGANFQPIGDNHHNAKLCPYCSPAPPEQEAGGEK